MANQPQLSLRSIKGGGVQHPRPVSGFSAQALHDRIVPNVTGLEFVLTLIANAVIEKIVLPDDSEGANLPCLPPANDNRHSGGRGKTQERVPMIGHEQDQMAAPQPFFVIECGGLEQGSGQSGLGQGLAILTCDPDANVKIGAVANPGGYTVMKSVSGIGGHR